MQPVIMRRVILWLVNQESVFIVRFYRAMLAQSAVMRLHVVRPSVRP